MIAAMTGPIFPAMNMAWDANCSAPSARSPDGLTKALRCSENARIKLRQDSDFSCFALQTIKNGMKLRKKRSSIVSKNWLFHASSAASRGERVCHQQGNGHRTDAALDRRDRYVDSICLLEIVIANYPL